MTKSPSLSTMLCVMCVTYFSTQHVKPTVSFNYQGDSKTITITRLKEVADRSVTVTREFPVLFGIRAIKLLDDTYLVIEYVNSMLIIYDVNDGRILDFLPAYAFNKNLYVDNKMSYFLTGKCDGLRFVVAHNEEQITYITLSKIDGLPAVMSKEGIKTPGQSRFLRSSSVLQDIHYHLPLHMLYENDQGYIEHYIAYNEELFCFLLKKESFTKDQYVIKPCYVLKAYIGEGKSTTYTSMKRQGEMLKLLDIEGNVLKQFNIKEWYKTLA